MIYADNAATTRISDTVFEKMLPFLREEYGNPSAPYAFGTKAERAIEHSRKQVAEAIGAEPSEIIFTSGGSEGNSWVIGNLAKIYSNEPVHIITSAVEHHSVLNACKFLKNCGAEITYLPTDENGRISIKDLESSLRSNTKLVTIMLANNEIGTLQPAEEIGVRLSERGIPFHADAVQATGHIPINVRKLKADFLTASAHKFNGPKGAGFVYLRKGTDLPRMIFGGGQENGLRPGTENVAGIVALGHALEENVTEMQNMEEKISRLSRITSEGLKKAIPEIRINAENAKRLPGILSVRFPNASGESVVQLLDLKGICVSAGSACNSGKNAPSHVLLALGLSEEQAKSSVRISYGKYNTVNEAEKIVNAIADAYSKIKASRF